MVKGLNLSQDGALLRVELDNGPGNEFTQEMCFGLTDILANPPASASVLVLTAVGDAFCTGRDRSARLPGEMRSMALALAEANIALLATRLTVVAKVEGDAAGFGVGLVGLADVAIVADGSRFWFPEVRDGLSPALVLAWLPYVVGRRKAFWMTASGEEIDAVEACRIGLATEVVPSALLDERTNSIVKTLMLAPSSVCAEIKSDLPSHERLAIITDSRAAADRLVLRTLVRQQADSLPDFSND